MPAELVRGLHLQEDVHEDLEPHEVDVLEVKEIMSTQLFSIFPTSSLVLAWAWGLFH